VAKFLVLFAEFEIHHATPFDGACAVMLAQSHSALQTIAVEPNRGWSCRPHL
jgi:hypothetical protein